MSEKAVILHVPVIHRGYLDLFSRIAPRARELFILGEDIVKKLYGVREIASIRPAEAKKLIEALGLFSSVKILGIGRVSEIKNRPLILASDEISRRFAKKFFPQKPLEWESVFLRWDIGSVSSANAIESLRISREAKDSALMEKAYAEALKSGDWWRRVGAVLVGKGKILARSHNHDLPHEQASYQWGNIRDHLKAGERPDLANAIHAETEVISRAAKKGIRVNGARLYVTHFPCPMCAKAIVCSGISAVFFSEGSANFDAEMVLKDSGVRIIRVPLAAS